MTNPTPKTLVEQLDAARDGNEFGGALLGFMRAYDKARDEAEAEEMDDE